MPRGRPVRSEIRQNLVEILYVMGRAYGYDLYKAYIKMFPKVTIRSIYYNLKKGVSLEEFEVEKIETVQGDYSWGHTAQKIFYTLGRNAKPRLDKRVAEALRT
ncbi:MAG: hypothetical protein ABIC95_05235 [archaeon]